MWAVDVNGRARDLCRSERRDQRGRQRARVDARRRARRRPLRLHLEQPADPHRQAGAARPVAALALPTRPGRLRGDWSCTSTSAPTRCSAGSPTSRATPPSGSPRRAATGLLVSRTANCSLTPSASGLRTFAVSAAGRPRCAGALPFGRGVAAIAAPSSSHVGARSSTASPADDASSPVAAAKSAAPAPLTEASAANGGRPSSSRRLSSTFAARDGSACRTACSTSWRGRNVCTSSRPPPRRSPTSRAARASSAIACSPARYRGASSSASRSRKATTSALRGAVQHGLGADQHVAVGQRVAVAGDHADRPPGGSLDLLAQPRRRPGAATTALRIRSSGRPPGGPCRSAGRPASRRRPARPPPGSARNAAATCRCGTPAAAPDPWCCARRPPAARGCAGGGSAATSTASASTAPRAVRSTSSRIGQPSRSSATDGRRTESPAQCNAVADGHGDTSTLGTPARRARSIATSRACQVGERSSCSASSCSSSTTIERIPAHGDHTALRPPITTSTPPQARAHCSGCTAVE